MLYLLASQPTYIYATILSADISDLSPSGLTIGVYLINLLIIIVGWLIKSKLTSMENTIEKNSINLKEISEQSNENKHELRRHNEIINRYDRYIREMDELVKRHDKEIQEVKHKIAKKDDH